MKRSEFIRTAILGIMTASPAPVAQIIPIPDEIQKMNWEVLPSRKVIVFKVTFEAVSDSQIFDWILKENGYTEHEVKSVVLGFIDDDFIKNMMTCKIIYV